MTTTTPTRTPVALTPDSLPTAPDPTLPEIQRVAELLRERGRRTYVEYPGALAIVLDGVHDVWTGQHGWDSGDVNRLVAGCMEPTEHVLAVDLPADATPEQVADAWMEVAAEWLPPTPPATLTRDVTR